MEAESTYLENLKDGTSFITEYTKRKATLLYKTVSAAYIEIVEPKTIETRNDEGYLEERTILTKKREPWSLKTIVIPTKRQYRKKIQKEKEKK